MLSRLSLSLCLISTSVICAVHLGDSVNNLIDNAKQAICHKVDGTIADVQACRELRDRDQDSTSYQVYSLAMQQLHTAAQRAGNAATYFLTHGRQYAEGTQQGASEVHRRAKHQLQSAAEQAYTAAGKLIEHGQSYVEEARRAAVDVYNEALVQLNHAAEEAKVIAEEVFQGKQDPYNEPWENHDQIQDAYERVSDAAAKGLGMAFETFSELRSHAFLSTNERGAGERGDQVLDDQVNREGNAPTNEHMPSDGHRKGTVEGEEGARERRAIAISNEASSEHHASENARTEPHHKTPL